MKRILYVMHISWGWIKQRPQFLAEELAVFSKVDVFYRKSNQNKQGSNPSFQKGNLTVAGFRNLPFERITWIPVSIAYLINKLFWNLKRVDISSYDYVWVTDPVLWWILKKKINRKKTQLIYDCMDDYSAFPYIVRYPKYRSFEEREERALIADADYVFCSAKALRDKLVLRYGIDRNYYIINNAIADNIFEYKKQLDDIALPANALVYIGTISEWFDFESTIKALNEFPMLHVVLYGPIRMADVPRHDRLEFRGPTLHSSIMAIMSQSKALFMPFVLNDLIESVNPVKIYEYLYSGKPVLATRYGETIPFEGNVTLYSNYNEFREFIIKNVISESHCVDEERNRMVALENTWSSRVQQILRLINSL